MDPEAIRLDPDLTPLMKILLSSICLETGTDIQLALYYLKGYLLKIKPAQKGRTRLSFKAGCCPDGALYSRRSIWH